MTESDRMCDHWWWRPGWETGRSFYTWHITFADQPGTQRLVDDYAPVLAALPQIDPIPVRWLHLTLPGIGFTEEVDLHDIDLIVDAARERCAELEPITVTIGPAHVDPESIQMPARPLRPLADLRLAIRAAIGDVRGTDNVPEAEAGFRAHVSLGYSNTAGPMKPVARALDAHGGHTGEVVVSSVSLINPNRDHKAYEWTDVATVLLGPSQANKPIE
ncbi:2'-5' RNA ligase family protein [Saccharothrix obliqua]|uniref:2'-5' RNA ligase family protein n=1 Tax=Saccharothrix obliqua TaxID=2861747 RepID=UPI001C5FDD8B|nr:2'-5' RNA ligase family protein [Saccharothrix obliqua]MBW4722311.1 2'-5' RNA ligase family protein [Saccharothrix obliqua]